MCTDGGAPQRSQKQTSGDDTNAKGGVYNDENQVSLVQLLVFIEV